MHEVFCSDDGACRRLARFRTLDDALRFIDERRGERSWAIRLPTGRWYHDPETGRAIFGPRRGRVRGALRAVGSGRLPRRPLEGARPDEMSEPAS